MLPNILTLVGVDLRRHLTDLKTRVDDFTRDTTNRFKDEIEDLAKDLALTIGLAMVGAAFGLVSFGVLLVGTYRRVETLYGSDIALITIGGISAGMMMLMFLMAASRTGADRKTQKHSSKESKADGAQLAEDGTQHLDAVEARAQPASSIVSPSISPTDSEHLHRPLATALRDLLTIAPSTGTPLDTVLKQVTHSAAGASGQTVDMAAHIVRTGPRKAIYGVLGASVLLGWYLSRKRNRV